MTEPTQFGDNVAAEMRAYFEAHKREKWVEGTADNLMLGLFNIAIRAIEATRSSVTADDALRDDAEPTAAMIEAGVEALEDTSPDTSEAFVTMIFKAMISARSGG